MNKGKEKAEYTILIKSCLRTFKKYLNTPETRLIRKIAAERFKIKI